MPAGNEQLQHISLSVIGNSDSLFAFKIAHLSQQFSYNAAPQFVRDKLYFIKGV